MKYILFAALFCSSMVAHSAQICANKEADKGKISDLLSKVDLFGYWSGVHDGKTVLVEVGKTTAGRFAGKVTMGNDVIGPTGITICDNNGQYSVKVYFYEADFTVQAKNKIAITLPMDGNPIVNLTRSK